MTQSVTEIHVQVVTDRPHMGFRHVELHFDQPMLVTEEGRTIIPGNHALDHIDECTPFLQNALREFFGPTNIGVTQVITSNEHLTVDCYAALTLERILEILKEAAFRAGIVYASSSDSA